jgi:serine/threonine protein kinase
MEPELIGKGGYGCAFTPPLKCRKSKIQRQKGQTGHTRVVGKLMRKDDADIELNISTVIKGIPGYERYFIVQEEDKCDTKNFKKIKKTYSSICPPIRDLQDTEMIQLVSKYGGKSLHNISITDSFDFMASFKHVLEGVYKLNKQGICHLDLKADNMLVDIYGTIRIIDFGISFLGDMSTEQTVKEHQFPFSPEYNAFPPELAVQEGIVKGMSVSYAIQQSILQKKIFVTAASLLGLSLRDQENSLRTFWEEDPVWIETRGKTWAKWFRTYWKAWDSWAIGVVFLKLLEKCLLIPSFINGQWAKNRETLVIVLKGLLQANPNLRLTSEEAFKLISEAQ